MGIDPSLSGTGIAGSDGFLHTIKTKTEWGEGERHLVIYRQMVDALKLDEPEFAVLEDLPANAMSAGLTGRAQGIIRLVLAQYKVPYIALPPATLKKWATGKGNAKKPVMRAAWLEFSGHDNKDDNQVDAAWLRQAGLYLKGEPVALPEEQLAALAAYHDPF
jgi:Holliday junction resolvasome RuvABC endonuclease subunit